MSTKSQEIASDLVALFRARNPIIWIVTREEQRVEGHIFEAAAAAGYLARFWDVAQGVTELDGKTSSIGGNDPGDTMRAIMQRARGETVFDRCVWVMRDLPVWLNGPPMASTMRQLRNLGRYLPMTTQDKAQAIVILSPSGDVPAELSESTTVVEWAMPDRAEIAEILDAAIASIREDMRDVAAPNGTRDAAIDAAVGLSGEEASSCFARSLVQKGRIEPSIISKEKRRVIARERILEWYDPLPGGLDAVGGLDVLKTWLVARRDAYSADARAYGLPSPKGAMLVGISGCGKSLTAKAIATAWGVPLLKVDLGALKSKFVGESEANLRKAFRVIEAIGRCVVWFDEVEKSLQGATSGSADGGVSSDALGAILTWMQERRGDAFVIATANDVSTLPPEFLRKGRFDEVFWIDLPNGSERVSILDVALNSFGKNHPGIDRDKVATICSSFTGSEVAAIVPDAMFAAFADGKRDVTTDDLIAAATNVVPLASTAKEKIEKMREWAKERARPATSPATDKKPKMAARGGRQLDI